MATTGQRQMTNIYLCGALGKAVGPKWRLAVTSPSEALRAININTRGKLNDYLYTKGKNRYYKICLQSQDKAIDKNEIHNRSGNSDIYIVPTVKGKNSGTAKIVIGVVLVAAVIWATGGFGGPSLIGALSTAGGTVPTLAGWAAGAVFGIGTSLIMGGISQLLAPHQSQQQGQIESNSFAGSIAAGVQGGSVPIVYGKALVAPTTVSIWTNALDYNLTTNSYQGAIDITSIQGGGTQYTPVGTDSVVGGT